MAPVTPASAPVGTDEVAHVSDNDDWDDEPAPAPKKARPAPAAADDDWDDDWDDEAPRGGRRDMTLIYAVVAATIVIVLAIVLTNNKGSDNGGGETNQATGNTETTVKKDLVWQGPVAEAVNNMDKRMAAETGVFIWTDFQGWHVRSNLKDPVSVDVTADAIVKKGADGKAAGNPKTEITETLPAGDGKTGLDLDLQFSNTATYKVTVNGTPVPATEIKLGGAKGVADQNPVTFTKA